MKRAILWLLALGLIAAVAVVGWRLVDERRFAATRFGEGSRTVNIPPGTGPHALGRLLADARVVSDANRFFTHLRWFRRNAHTKAGEYQFDGALLPDEVIGKIVRDPLSPKKYGVPGPSLEGYLFPDTYSVPHTAGCAGIVQAMVFRFQKAWQHAEAQRADTVRLDDLQGVTLASIIEKETGRPEERARISCVFHNRLKKGMRLQTDPTVVYALLLSHDYKWDHNIHKSDLTVAHPYNTYVIKGLPPGPIANPGQASLEAALHPMACDDLFFVSRNDHSHVFCPDLKCHEANVRKFQVEYFRRRRG